MGNAHRVASRYTRKLYADYIGDMSRPRALTILGFPPNSIPSEEEINKAWKHKSLEKHPDRGGTHEQMVEVNVARDYLTGKGRRVDWRPEPAPKPKPPEPKPVVDTIKGAPFHEGLQGVPEAEWLFISKPEWVSYSGSTHPGQSADAWVVFGKTPWHIVVVGIKHRKENFYYDPAKDGRVNIESDWDSRVTTIPIQKDLIKEAPAAVKKVMTSFKDGASPRKVPQKYVAWSGGTMSEKAVDSVKFGAGGASLKDMLLSTGLVSEEHKGLQGRKTNVEITPKYNREKEKQLRQERMPLKKPVYAWEAFDYYVSVNGKPGEKLADETLPVLDKKGFFMVVFNWQPNDGVPKNLTKMRGGRFGLNAAQVLKLLSESMTNEPQSLVSAISKAADEWQTIPEKTSYDRRPV